MTISVIMTGHQGLAALAPANLSHTLSIQSPGISFLGIVTPDLVIEDGSVVYGADSFVTLEATNTYFMRIRWLGWAALSVEDRKAFLRQAALFLGFAYIWRGGEQDPLQPLCWPRVASPAPPFTVPREVQVAQMLLAREASLAPLGVLPDGGNVVTSITERLDGVGSTSKSFEGPRFRSDDLRRYPQVEAIIARFIFGPRQMEGAAMVPLTR